MIVYLNMARYKVKFILVFQLIYAFFIVLNIIYIIYFSFKTRISNPMPQSGFEITCWVLSHHGLLMLLDWGEDK